MKTFNDELDQVLGESIEFKYFHAKVMREYYIQLAKEKIMNKKFIQMIFGRRA